MNATLPLRDMSVDEKLRLIETVWEDLERHGNEIPMPPWHEEALAEAERRAAVGKNESIGWEEAKRLLRDRFA